MRIYEVPERSSLLPALLALWEASVRATHLFLSDAEITKIKAYVPQALYGVAHLAVADVCRAGPPPFWERRTGGLRCCSSPRRSAAPVLAGSFWNTESAIMESVSSPSTSRTRRRSASMRIWAFKPIDERILTRKEIPTLFYICGDRQQGRAEENFCTACFYFSAGPAPAEDGA